MNTSDVTHVENEEIAVGRPGERRGFMVVRIALGVLLLATAGLKLFDPSPDAFSGLELLSSSRWRMAAIEAEALLGLWLLIGAYPRLLWLTALFCFTLLASVSMYLGIEGQSSCGCFGARLPVSPWYALALDLTAIVALAWWPPPPRHGTGVPSLAISRQVLAVVASAAVLLAVGLGGLAWMYGSPYEALLHVRGESITVEPSVTQVGDGIAGEQRTFTVQLSNHQVRPVKILGGTTTCSCIATDDLPITVPLKDSRSITIRITFRGNPGRFQHSFVLYTDEEMQPTVTAAFTGRVIESPSP
jgi:hypothetical protein